MGIRVKVISQNPTDFVLLDSMFRRAKNNGIIPNFDNVYSYGDISSAISEESTGDPTCFFICQRYGEEDYNVIRQIRLNKDFLFAPVVVVGENETPEMITDFIKHGVQVYVKKRDLDNEKFSQLLKTISGKVKIWENLKSQQVKKNEHLAIVSHDLKSPLTIIKSYMNIILNDKSLDLPEYVTEKLKRSKYNAELALNLVMNILDEFRAKRNWRFEYKKTLFNKLVQESCDNLALKISQKNLKIDFSADEDFYVYADVKSMLQLITNVLDNAIKYSPENGTIFVKLRIYTSNAVSTDRNKKFVNLIIADEGEGIPKDKLALVFDSYQRVDDKEEAESFGLGLSICKRICQFHLGRIWAVNRTPSGAAIHVLLPVFNSKDMIQDNGTKDLLEKPVSGNEVNSDLIMSNEKKEILVVDDLEDIRILTSEVLDNLGFEVKTASNIEEAFLCVQKKTPDLIMLDLNMPGGSGEIFLDRLHTFPLLSKIPVFIYSVLKSDVTYSKCIKKAHGFFQKPLAPAEFVSKTALLLNWQYTNFHLGTKQQDTENAKVLLVDNCIDNHEILKYFLVDSTHTLVSSMSGEDCLNKIQKENFDIILMDISMPGLNGYQTLERLRKWEDETNQKSRMPVLAFSVKDVDLDTNLAKQHGFDGFLEKPIGAKRIAEVINLYCS